MRAALVALWLACGCAASHVIPDDGADASALPDGGLDPTDAGVPPPTGPGPACGPNRCRASEVCCDDRCGVCAFEGECPTMFVCPDP